MQSKILKILQDIKTLADSRRYIWGKKLSGMEWSGAEWSHGVESVL